MKLLRELLCAAATVALLASAPAKIAAAGEPSTEVDAPTKSLLDQIKDGLKGDPTQTDLANLLVSVENSAPQMSSGGKHVLLDYFARLHADADKMRDAEPAKSIKLTVFADLAIQYIKGNGDTDETHDSPPTNQPTPATIVVERPAMPVAPPAPAPASTVPVGPAPALALLDRADTMMGRNDLGAARMLFQRAIASGSGMAAFKLAETYDPAFLADHHYRGIKPDPTAAEKWYHKAQDMGVAQAGDRLRRLDGHNLANLQ